MSNDRTEQEFHLTPDGWIAGTLYVYGTKTEEVPTPVNRIETWIEEVNDSSGWAPEAVHWTLRWESPDISLAARGALRNQFPQPRHKPRPAIPKKKRKKLADCY